MSILSHLAKNSLDDSLALFYAKNLYHNTHLLEGQENYIDLWYSKPLYGKVDANLHLVQPSSLHMEELNSTNLNLGGRSMQARDTQGKEGVLALNFVADAFKAMAGYMRDTPWRHKRAGQVPAPFIIRTSTLCILSLSTGMFSAVDRESTDK